MNARIIEDIELVAGILKRKGCIKNIKKIDGNESIIPAGGKMLRPLLVVTSARLCGYEGERHIACAAAVEIFHNATLFHDDVIDFADTRRGKISLNKKFGGSVAILAGDLMFARSFELAVGSGCPEVVAALSGCLSELVFGQLEELDHDRDLNCSIEDYYSIIDKKTASLLRTSAVAGALAASAEKGMIALLSDITYRAGRLFQIADDILDYLGEPCDTGKRRFQDLIQGKMTLPAILMLKLCGADEKSFFSACLGSAALTEAAATSVLEMMSKYGVFDKIFKDYRKQHGDIKNLINELPAGTYLNDFEELIEMIVGRLYKIEIKETVTI